MQFLIKTIIIVAGSLQFAHSQEQDPYSISQDDYSPQEPDSYVADFDDSHFEEDQMRSYKYDESRSRQLATKQSFASPCTANRDCTNNCCKKVVYNQKYSYYSTTSTYRGYAVSYGVYTYRYASYYPTYKIT